MHDDLERLQRLLREARGRTATATLAAALADDEGGLPAGARGARLMARARAAAGLDGHRASIVVRAIDQVIEVLSGGLSLPARVRGEARAGVLVRERLGDHEVAAHIDLIEECFLVTLDLGVDAAARGVRVALFTMARDGREVASDAVTQGRLRLPEMASGQWQVRLQDAAGWSATLDLDLAHRAA